MPLLRYFLYVGGLLLVLMLVSNVYFPPLVTREVKDIDRTTIRIASKVTTPAAVTIDTTLPTTIPAPLPAPQFAQTTQPETIRQALAQMDANEVAPKKAPPRKRRIVRAPRQQKMMAFRTENPPPFFRPW